MSLYRTVNRVTNSLAKRLFWRRHLTEAMQELERRRNELPTTEMMLALPLLFRGKGYYQSLELKQNMTELLSLVNLLKEQKLERVCEIGTLRGGTLFIWCQLASPTASIYSIDLPGGEFGGGYHEKSIPFFQSFRKPRQTLECLRGNSHSSEIKNNFSASLNGRKLDFLFIDGDHSYAGVRQDYLDYSPFVKKGGLIAFHDIVRRDGSSDIEVWKFWQELKQQDISAVEFIENAEGRRKIGIGVVRS